MTVCIAAICDDGKGLVLAADRMVTVGGLNLEVERSRSKISLLGAAGFGMMSAGDGLLSDEVVACMRDDLGVISADSIDKAADLLLDKFGETRRRKTEERILRPIQHTHESFKNDGLKQLGAQVHAALLQQLGQFDVGAEFVLTGFKAGAARIAHIVNPGTLRWTDSMEFYAIGSGAIHVIISLMLSGYSASWNEQQALLHVYLAKRAAEAAPGVGNATDVVLLHDGSAPLQVADELLEELSSLHDAEVERRQNHEYGRIQELLDAARKAE